MDGHVDVLSHRRDTIKKRTQPPTPHSTMAKGHAGKGKAKKHRTATSASGSAAAGLRDAGRAARRNTAKAAPQHARFQVLSAHRAAATTAPKVISLVAAGSAADPAALAKLLLAHAPEENGVVDATMAIKKEKQRLTLLQPARTISAVLEASKAADILMLCIPADGGLDPLGEQLVDALSMQGVGTVVGVLQGAEALPLSRRGAARKQWSASLETRFPMNSKFFSLDTDPTASTLMRHLLALTPRPLSWRTHASYVLAHTYTYTPLPASMNGKAAITAPLVTKTNKGTSDEDSEDAAAIAAAAAAAEVEPCGTLVIEGYVRGLPLSIDRAIHVPGVGDVLPESITILEDPLSGKRGGGEEMMAVEEEMVVRVGKVRAWRS